MRADITLRRWLRVKLIRQKAACSKCESRIVFGETTEGKFVPLNPVVVPGQKWPPIWRLTQDGKVSQWSGEASMPGLRSHRCPTAKSATQ